MNRPITTYRDAGVDIDAANEAVQRMKQHVRTTFTPDVLTDVGSFGGVFSLGSLAAYREPALVSSIDGVGTKVKIASQASRHRNIGHDLVNHCINDILVQGARPLFFLDYFGTGRLQPSVAEELVQGLSEACRAASCALIGGETAEMPGLYPENEYDLAGCIVGVVEREKILDGSNVRPGDAVVGLASSGLHTNGYSLARHVLLEGADALSLFEPVASLGCTLADALLAPHRCYAPSLHPLLAEFDVHGIAHITGGGFYDNIPRIAPANCCVQIDRRSWLVPPVFTLIQERGNVPDPEMFRTFNMGIGMVVILPAEQAAELSDRLSQSGCPSSIIGSVRQGVHEVEIV